MTLEEFKKQVKEDNLKHFFKMKIRMSSQRNPFGDVIELPEQAKQPFYQKYQQACDLVDAMQSEQDIIQYLGTLKHE